jgi:hypothetical protein
VVLPFAGRIPLPAPVQKKTLLTSCIPSHPYRPRAWLRWHFSSLRPSHFAAHSPPCTCAMVSSTGRHKGSRPRHTDLASTAAWPACLWQPSNSQRQTKRPRQPLTSTAARPPRMRIRRPSRGLNLTWCALRVPRNPPSAKCPMSNANCPDSLLFLWVVGMRLHSMAPRHCRGQLRCGAPICAA